MQVQAQGTSGHAARRSLFSQVGQLYFDMHDRDQNDHVVICAYAMHANLGMPHYGQIKGPSCAGLCQACRRAAGLPSQQTPQKLREALET